MKLLIDTNVIIDVLIKREPFYDNSKSVLALCEDKRIKGFVTASSITDIFYLVRKALKDIEYTYKVMEALLDTVGILNVTNKHVQEALLIKAKDFEDCLMAVCAKSNHCSGIVTRDNNDFIEFGIDIYSPEEIVKRFQPAV